MNRVKTFAKYALWIILFWIFSDILINVAINTTYKNINRIGEIPNGIQVIEMEATAVNGRIKLIVNNTQLSGKYVKINLYSDLENLLGTQHLSIGNISEGEQKEISTYFKIPEVKKYEITIEDVEGKSTEGFMDTAMSTITMIISAIQLLFVL